MEEEGEKDYKKWEGGRRGRGERLKERGGRGERLKDRGGRQKRKN